MKQGLDTRNCTSQWVRNSLLIFTTIYPINTIVRIIVID